MELREDVFNIPIKQHILHQVVVSQLHNRRSGCASTKNRSQVTGSGTKLRRQKGTGRARVGTASSPTRKGGGVAFGPSPRKYTKKVPKKIKRAALCMALTDKYMNGRLVVLNDFNLPEIKTKHFVKVMVQFDVRKALIVTEDKNEILEKSSHNVPWVKILRVQGLNVYDILNSESLFLLKPAIEKIEEAMIS
jgi:large subunit ribosomal protein L4